MGNPFGYQATQLSVRLTVEGIIEERIPIQRPESGEIIVRVLATGICHSDAHYRSGVAPPPSLPVTLGHEVAGTVEAIGDGVSGLSTGDRVALHYLISCGSCRFCRAGTEQFCASGRMLGKDVDGGFAEMVRVPARNALPLPHSIPIEWGAVMMCSTATSFHAIRKARLRRGERAAVFGIGGLGLSAIQLLFVEGASEVFAVDLSTERLAVAAELGARPVSAAKDDPVKAILEETGGDGVDVSLELLGKTETIQQCCDVLAPLGRAVVVGISGAPVQIDTYRSLINGERELIGVSDHLRSELERLIDLADNGKIDLSSVVTETVELSASAINAVLDRLDTFGKGVRSVVVPASSA